MCAGLSPRNQCHRLTRPSPFLTLCVTCPQLCPASRASPPHLAPSPHPGMVQRPCFPGRAEEIILHSLLWRKPGVDYLGVHPGASHFLSMFWEKTLAIFMPPQGGTKAVIKHYSGQPLLSTWQIPFSLWLQKALHHLPWSLQCVHSVPWFPFSFWARVGELFGGCGSVLPFDSFQASTPPQTSLIGHMFFLPEPQAGLHPKPWDNAPNLSHSPQPLPVPPPREEFHMEGKRWLLSKE